MPEGHTIHRLARLHRRALRGRVVAADSPQGRFAQGAGVIDGQSLRTVEAHGKHLFYAWSGGDVLHVHLGLYGRFRSLPRDGGGSDPDRDAEGAGSASGGAAEQPLPVPSAGTRLRLVTETTVLHLSGPTACELIDPAVRETILARLGPDPLRPGADPQPAWAALRRRRIAIGAALLDQRVIAGIGNVYRAELLFRCGLRPSRPAADVSRRDLDRLWAEAVRLLRAGERAGRIVTVEPSDVGVATLGQVPAGERLYVYQRAGLPCRRCGTIIERGDSALRTISWCPTCQPR